MKLVAALSLLLTAAAVAVGLGLVPAEWIDGDAPPARAAPADQRTIQEAPSAPSPSSSPAVMTDAVPVETSHDPLTAQDTGCEETLASMGVDFEVLDPIAEPEEPACNVERPLLVSKAGINLEPAIVARCETAKALALWIDEVLIPSAVLHLGDAPVALVTGTSYQCRKRRGAGEVKVSEHARANAVDVTGVTFEEREPVEIMERPGSAAPARAFQAAARGGACAYFTTVLGPGTNSAHGDHLHLDNLRRANGYRICQ
jgi:hypothetical protein